MSSCSSASISSRNFLLIASVMFASDYKPVAHAAFARRRAPEGASRGYRGAWRPPTDHPGTGFCYLVGASVGLCFSQRVIIMKKKKIRAAKSAKASHSKNGHRSATSALPQQRTYEIPDHRLEKPIFTVRQVRTGKEDEVHYEISGDLSAPVPPIRESKYLSKQQCIEIYRWMVLNRKMETALENLYKQGKVVGGVYFGLGQEACYCASAYALAKDDWLAPMIPI